MTTIHSVSIIPYFENGYLFCTEMRKKFPTKNKELKIHLIGGKVEHGENPLFAACREFCEEVVFDFNIDVLYNQISNCNPLQFDLEVSPSKKLSNRFYIFNTRLIQDQSLKHLLNSIVDNFNVEKSPLMSLFYWDGVSRLTNTTNLVDAFINSSIRINDSLQPTKFVNQVITATDIIDNNDNLNEAFNRLNIKDSELFNEDSNYARLLNCRELITATCDETTNQKIDNNSDNSINVENELNQTEIIKSKSEVDCCQVILKHGPRTGEICSRKLNKNSHQFCSSHLPRSIARGLMDNSLS
jgi:hypothetical protein